MSNQGMKVIIKSFMEYDSIIEKENGRRKPGSPE
jgi:hypothetical protein